MSDIIGGIRLNLYIILLFICSLLSAVLFFPCVSFSIPMPQMQDTDAPPLAIVLPDVLWNQAGDIADADITSQDFIDGGGIFDAYDSRAADDFLVPDGMFWKIKAVKVFGTFDELPPDQIQSVDVVFYYDSEGLPGKRVTECVYEDILPVDILDPSFLIDLPNQCLLQPGLYWVSVRANMLFILNGQWFWFENTVRRLSPFVWENPGDGFGTGCVRFTPAQEHCDADFPDLAFQIVGREFPIIRPIPALGEWGMIVTAVTLGFIGIAAAVLRRRRVKA